MKLQLLDAAIKIAARAHADQKDKSGQPYILHPLRVMFKMRDPIDQIIAVLHDVLEDCDLGPFLVSTAAFPDEVLDALQLLTRVPKMPYDQYIQKIMVDPRAVRVKIADLEDNMDITRLHGFIQQTDIDRLLKYKTAYTVLTSL